MSDLVVEIKWQPHVFFVGCSLEISTWHSAGYVVAKSLQDPSVGAANADVETLASKFGIGFDPWVCREFGWGVPRHLPIIWHGDGKTYEGNCITSIICTAPWWLPCALRWLSSHICFRFAHHRREFHGSKNDMILALISKPLNTYFICISDSHSFPHFIPCLSCCHATLRRRCVTFVPRWQREQLLIPGWSQRIDGKSICIGSVVAGCFFWHNVSS